MYVILSLKSSKSFHGFIQPPDTVYVCIYVPSALYTCSVDSMTHLLVVGVIRWEGKKLCSLLTMWRASSMNRLAGRSVKGDEHIIYSLDVKLWTVD